MPKKSSGEKTDKHKYYFLFRELWSRQLVWVFTLRHAKQSHAKKKKNQRPNLNLLIRENFKWLCRRMKDSRQTLEEKVWDNERQRRTTLIIFSQSAVINLTHIHSSLKVIFNQSSEKLQLAGTACSFALRRGKRAGVEKGERLSWNVWRVSNVFHPRQPFSGRIVKTHCL